MLSRLLPLLLTLLAFASGCQVIEGIFKAGMWVGIIMVVLVVLIIGWLMRKMKGRQ